MIHFIGGFFLGKGVHNAKERSAYNHSLKQLMGWGLQLLKVISKVFINFKP